MRRSFLENTYATIYGGLASFFAEPLERGEDTDPARAFWMGGLGLLVYLCAYTAIYGGIHAVALWGLDPVCREDHWRWLAFAWSPLMVLAPVASRVLEYSRWRLPAAALAWLTYLWMGFIFLLFFFVLCLKGLDQASWLLSTTLPLELPNLDGQFWVVAALVASGLAFIYGWREAQRLRVEHLELTSERIATPIKMALISDQHLSLTSGDARLRPVLEILRREKPDLLLSAGDLLDGHLKSASRLAQSLAQLPTPLGKYAVLGNHDLYLGQAGAEDFHRQAGFQLLQGQPVCLPGGLCLAGLDDDPTLDPQLEARVLERAPADSFLIYLKHRPSVPPQTVDRFDLQLSGHTHGGQIFPFGALVALVFPFLSGLHCLGTRSQLYVSRGSGVWGPPLRFLAPPEVSVIHLRPARS